MAPGNQKVQIRASKVVGKKKLYDDEKSPYQDILEEILPAKYNDQTELTLDIQPGENHQDYDLTTK